MPNARSASDSGNAWETRSSLPLPEQAIQFARARFRLHTSDHEAPAAKRLFIVALWSAACVFVGFIPAARLVAALTFGDAPFWYPLVSIAIGVLGIGMIAGAFAAIHRTRMPWYLLGAATVLLATNVWMIYAIL